MYFQEFLGDDIQTNSPTLENSPKQKRPPNAYILYCLENRTSLRMQNPDLPNIEISKMLGDKWRGLDESQRRPYKEKAKELQADFKKQNPDYKYEKARKKRIEQEMLTQNRNHVAQKELIQNGIQNILNIVRANGLSYPNFDLSQQNMMQYNQVNQMQLNIDQQDSLQQDFHPFDMFDQH